MKENHKIHHLSLMGILCMLVRLQVNNCAFHSVLQLQNIFGN